MKTKTIEAVHLCALRVAAVVWALTMLAIPLGIHMTWEILGADILAAFAITLSGNALRMRNAG